MAIHNISELHVLIEFQLFFLNKCSSDCCKLLVGFQGSVKVDFDNYCQYSHCLYRRADILEILTALFPVQLLTWLILML